MTVDVPRSHTLRPGVLLDRDGTIIVDHGYVGQIDRVELIEGAAEAIAALNAAGVPVAVVTNQAGVARGLYDLDDVRAVHEHLGALLTERGAHIDLWLFCPYHPDGTRPEFARASADRKPGPGLAYAAAEALELDLRKSWVVGDADADMGMAAAVGARGVRIGGAEGTHREIVVPSLREAVDLILASPPTASSAGRVHVPDSTFPCSRYDSVDVFASAYAEELRRALASVDASSIERAAKVLGEAYERDAAVFACGNGGSASIANHLQCDHVKGVRVGTDLRTRVVSLSTNMELVSAIANDIGYESIFEFQLQSQARPGDVLLTISSSGNSANIVRALQWAGAHGLETVSLTGFGGGRAHELAAVAVHVDCGNYGVVEDAHAACMHLLAQYVRQSRMTADVVASSVF